MKFKLEKREGLSLWFRYPSTVWKTIEIFNRTTPLPFAVWHALYFTFQIFRVANRLDKRDRIEWEWGDAE